MLILLYAQVRYGYIALRYPCIAFRLYAGINPVNRYVLTNSGRRAVVLRYKVHEFARRSFVICSEEVLDGVVDYIQILD